MKGGQCGGEEREGWPLLGESAGNSQPPSSVASDGQVRMISCGADKSIYFRTAQKVRLLGFPEWGSSQGWGWGHYHSPDLRLQEVKGGKSRALWAQ